MNLAQENIRTISNQPNHASEFESGLEMWKQEESTLLMFNNYHTTACYYESFVVLSAQGLILTGPRHPFVASRSRMDLKKILYDF